MPLPTVAHVCGFVQTSFTGTDGAPSLNENNAPGAPSIEIAACLQYATVTMTRDGCHHECTNVWVKGPVKSKVKTVHVAGAHSTRLIESDSLTVRCPQLDQTQLVG